MTTDRRALPEGVRMMPRLLLLPVVLLAPACAESSAEVNSPTAFDTRTADPEFIRGAEAVLEDAERAEDGWRVGVIIGERGDGQFDWEVAVLTSEGVQVLAAASHCDDDDGMDERQLPLIADPGDLITWSREGDDNRLCTAELTILRKAAA